MDQKKIDKVMKKLIEEAALIPGQRYAVIYYNNLGDWYSLCRSLRYAEKQSGKEMVLLYYQDKHKEIAEWFSSGDHKIKLFFLPKEEYSVLSSALNSEELVDAYKDYIITWFTKDNDFVRMTKNIDPMFVKKELSDPVFPEFSPVRYEEEYGIEKGNTIMINPMSNSVLPFPDWFWNLCAKIYETLGFKVLFNTDEKNASRFVSPSIMPPLSEMVNLLDYCGYFITTRTGLLDIASTSKARITVFSNKWYKPIDEVYGIDNEDGRIKTVFYENNDFFLEKSSPISLIYNAFRNEREGLKKIIGSLSAEIDTDSRDKEWISPEISAYKPLGYCNRLRRIEKMRIPEFFSARYDLYEKDGNLIFRINDLDKSRYRLDIELLYSGRSLYKLPDYDNSIMCYKLNKSGGYFLKIDITDKKTYEHEHFSTDTLFYRVKPPDTLSKLKDCNDFRAYFSALYDFKKDLLILIVSRDAHTKPYKCALTDELAIAEILNIKTRLSEIYRHSFLCVIDSGKVIFEESSADKTIKYEGMAENIRVYAESSGYNVKNSDKVPIQAKINDKEYAVDRRGLNVVVWDKSKNRPADSVCFDFFMGGAVHRNKV